VFNSFFFASFVIGYVCNLFTRQLILDILCSYGWQESFCIMISVCVFYTLRILVLFSYGVW
jgi:hypothetical protein